MPQTPAFISLVGPTEATAELFRVLQEGAPNHFESMDVVFLETPFKDYRDMRIGDKKKRDFSPPARACFGWGLFYEHNATVVRPVFERGADVVFIPQFGFDLYFGAVFYNGCKVSLALHQALIPFGVIGLGICPPLYVFSEHVDDRTRRARELYFAHDSGQRYRELPPELSVEEKAERIFTIVRQELEGRRRAA